MKVDLGQCAVCGAKNSKYVEKCYKCGAPLPWAPGFVAPKTTPQQPAPQPAAPSATPTDAGAKTVVIPPIDEPKPAPVVESPTPKGAPTMAERAQNKVQVPAWAIVAGGLGLLLLGMALWALLGKKPAPATVAVNPTPAATTAALAPIVPAATPQPTVAPTAQATTAPTSEPTAIATIAPTDAAPTTPAVAASGPTFDELYANLTTGTPQQQSLYWDSVKGRKINWRGEFVSLGNAATGPLVVNCKNSKGALKVIISLDATKPQTLPKYTPNQSVPFEGTLENRSAGAVAVKDGRAG